MGVGRWAGTYTYGFCVYSKLVKQFLCYTKVKSWNWIYIIQFTTCWYCKWTLSICLYGRSLCAKEGTSPISFTILRHPHMAMHGLPMWKVIWILGKRFWVEMGHKPLVPLLSTKQLNSLPPPPNPHLPTPHPPPPTPHPPPPTPTPIGLRFRLRVSNLPLIRSAPAVKDYCCD